METNVNNQDPWKENWLHPTLKENQLTMVDLVALDDDFFLVKFSVVDDYEYAMLGGSWMIFNHYLTMRQWHHNFDPNQSSLQSLLVSVRIPYLSIEYFNYKFLMTIGSKIGKPARIDDAASTLSRRHYAIPQGRKPS